MHEAANTLIVNGRERLALLVVVVAIAGFAPVSAMAAEPLALKKIMADIGRNMQSASYALLLEDYATVQKMADEIANHPEIPEAELVRIEGFLGSRMHKFELYDEKTHQLSLSLAKAAQKKDGQRAIATLHKLQSSCLVCHQAFRKPMIEHFYY